MDLQSVCLTCLLGQVEKAYKTLQIPYSNSEIVNLQKKIMGRLARVNSLLMPYYSQIVYQTIAENIGQIDPYKKLKEEYNYRALQLIPILKNEIAISEDPLLAAIKIAIMGNTIDFGTPYTIDIEKDVAEFSLNSLKINHYKDFISDFQKAEKIMIIGDNTGEVVFDLILIEFLHLNYPSKFITFAVRGGPAINDVTINDIKDLDLQNYCTIVEGSASPGVIMEQTTTQFQQAFKEADIILSKGQGNFESLDGIPLNRSSLYFLLKAKCNLVASKFDVPVGSLIFYHREQMPLKWN
ncbi:DUF89 domain-containing protein [Candidatus Lokiarchaeum ossiferum]|uniref:DUF89 domain-containing protein n=1 Tax=Candidatus Lokiarchaeum ossiferum TaxID=2951803 RepID=UPI00352E098A